MTPIILVSRSAEYESRLRSLFGRRLGVLQGVDLLLGVHRAVDGLADVPRIALLGPLLDFAETRDFVEALTRRHPSVGIVLVREHRSDLEDWVDELKIHAVVSPAATDQTILDLVDRLSLWLIANGKAAASDFDASSEVISDAASEVREGGDADADESAGDEADAVRDLLAAGRDGETDHDGGDAHVAELETSDAGRDAQATTWDFPPLESGAATEAIAVVAPKGGQGKTTLAINLAVGLAEVAPNSVVLVDGDLQFGDITAALALEPERTIVEAVESVDDELVLKTTLTHHPAGFFVIASAPSPEFADRVGPDALVGLIQRLRGLFRYVIIDTTPGLGEHTLVAIEQVTDAVFVSNMGVPSLRAMRTEFELLSTLGLMPANRHIVLNMSDRMSGLTPRDAERIIGAPIDVEVPRSSAVLLSANRGVPLIHDDVRDPAAKAVRSLVLRIAPDAHPKRSKILRRVATP